MPLPEVSLGKRERRRSGSLDPAPSAGSLRARARYGFRRRPPQLSDPSRAPKRRPRLAHDQSTSLNSPRPSTATNRRIPQENPTPPDGASIFSSDEISTARNGTRNSGRLAATPREPANHRTAGWGPLRRSRERRSKSPRSTIRVDGPAARALLASARR